MSEGRAYKDAGVDIEAGAEVVDRIGSYVKKTHRSGVMTGLGGFGALFDLKEAGYKDPILVSGTDGVGTKLKIALETGQHESIGIDLVAMCLNDILAQGAEPLFFLDYFATGRLEPDVAETVIAGIATGCAESGCALIGGETAEMPGLYAQGDYDLAGFGVGAVEREDLIDGSCVKEGDVILGLASDGVHANGFSLVRRIVETALGKGAYDRSAPFETSTATLGEFLLTPTRLYIRPVLNALKERDSKGQPLIRGMGHITGGGLQENIHRAVRDDLAVALDASTWDLPPVFRWLKQAGGLSDGDMMQTFNCGIGFVVICAPEGVDALKSCLEKKGEAAQIIGKVEQRQNKDTPFRIENTEEAWAV